MATHRDGNSSGGHRGFDGVAVMGGLNMLLPCSLRPGGGVTALASKKDYPVFIDSSSEHQDVISVSAGIRGTQILLKPQDYFRAVGAAVASIASAIAKR